jgi:hypothetical protein
MNERWIAEIKQMNTSPFHQKARRMLEAAGEDASEESLYGVQLALWGMRHGARDDADIHSPLGETIQAMITWGPERLKNFFLVGTANAPAEPDWSAMEDPRTMAKVILDEIEERIAIHFPWYYDLH